LTLKGGKFLKNEPKKAGVLRPAFFDYIATYSAVLEFVRHTQGGPGLVILIAI
jgi:hypothetical protein